MLQAVNYRIATLLAPKKARAKWFIIWYNFNPETQKLERVRKTCDLNKIEHIPARRALGLYYCKVINEALCNGWNIFIEPEVQAVSTVVESVNNFSDIRDALQYAYDRHSKTIKKRSRISYSSTMNLFFAWLKNNGLEKIPARELSTKHVYDFIDCRLLSGISNKTVNTNTGYLHKLFSILVKIKEVQENPFAVEQLPETDGNVYETFTQKELHTISEYLQRVDPDFALFTKFIYWAAIRPYHIAQYQTKQFDYANNIIYTLGATSKNRKSQPKQMLEPLRAALIAAGRNQLPQDWYLFGAGFKPSATACESLSTRATELWLQYVQRDLGIKKKMYALKHTAGQMYLNMADTVDMGWLQRQMEHASLEETDTYVRSRRVKKIPELNIPRY